MKGKDDAKWRFQTKRMLEAPSLRMRGSGEERRKKREGDEHTLISLVKERT